MNKTSKSKFQGWGVEAKPGDWSLLREHIEVVLAGGNEEFAEYIVRWIAWAVQNPAAQAEVALVLVGPKGHWQGHFGSMFATDIRSARFSGD